MISTESQERRVDSSSHLTLDFVKLKLKLTNNSRTTEIAAFGKLRHSTRLRLRFSSPVQWTYRDPYTIPADARLPRLTA